VKHVQAGYKVVTLSAFTQTPAPKKAADVHFIQPLTPAEERTSPEFFNVLAFALQFNPVIPEEVGIRERIAKIGIEAGKPFNVGALSEEEKTALVEGMKEGQKEIDAVLARSKSPAELCGTRAFLGNDYVRRAAGSQAVLFGAVGEEAYFTIMNHDAKGEQLDGSHQRRAFKALKNLVEIERNTKFLEHGDICPGANDLTVDQRTVAVEKYRFNLRHAFPFLTGLTFT
jgi:hypothetical protein